MGADSSGFRSSLVWAAEIGRADWLVPARRDVAGRRGHLRQKCPFGPAQSCSPSARLTGVRSPAASFELHTGPGRISNAGGVPGAPGRTHLSMGSIDPVGYSR
jgi:hypothetical protein